VLGRFALPGQAVASRRLRIALPLLAGTVLALGLPVAAAAQSGGSATPGVLASWDFREGHGRTAHDSSTGAGLDLTVRGHAHWTAHGLRLDHGASLASRGDAAGLFREARRGSGLTVEAWVKPGRGNLPGVSLLRLTGPRRDQTHVLLRTASGRAGRLTHLVWTRHAGGRWAFYVNGTRKATGRWEHFVRPGRDGRVVLAGGDHGWAGELRRVTVYTRVLTSKEISLNSRRRKPAPIPTLIAGGGVSTPSPGTAPTAGGTRPLLLKHGWDMPYPAYVRSHIAAMDTMPFDGLTISIPGLGDKVQRQAPVSYDQFRTALAPLVGLPATRLTHNYVTAYATPAGSVFSDWSVPVANFANLARAAREAGVEGIFFDNEAYYGSVYDFPGDCPGHTLVECQDQMRLRGRQVMDAMRAVWPGVRVLSAYGPWVSDPATARALSPYLPYNDVSWANELMGPFVVGLAQSAAGTAASVVDGGEIYSPRSTLQFGKVADWSRQGMAASPLVPTGLAASWSQTLRPGVAIYDQPWMGLPMDRATFASTIHNALLSDASVVWVYTERYDWWGSGWPSTPVPSDWVSAVAAARL
jgi:hypothetical protein